MDKPHGNSYIPVQFQHLGTGSVQIRWNGKSGLVKKTDPDNLRKLLLRIRPKLDKKSYTAFSKDVFATTKNITAPCRASNLQGIEEFLEKVDTDNTPLQEENIDSFLRTIARQANRSIVEVEKEWEVAVSITAEIFGKPEGRFSDKEFKYAKQTLLNALGIHESVITSKTVEDFSQSNLSLKDFITERNGFFVDFTEEAEPEEEEVVSTGFSIGEPGGIKKKKAADSKQQK